MTCANYYTAFIQKKYFTTSTCNYIIFITIFSAAESKRRTKMGRKDKGHKQGQSRNNPVFKVMGGGGKVNKQAGKQKAQEVKSKLKKITTNSTKSKESIISLDAQFKEIQHSTSGSISGSSKEKADKTAKKVEPLSGVLNAPEADMDGLMDIMEGSALTTNKDKKEEETKKT